MNNNVTSMVLNPSIDWAFNVLWIYKDITQAKAVYDFLQQAIMNDNADAYYILSRCYCGPQYVDPRFGFEVNYDLACQYLGHSILLGSALGTLGSRRLSGFNPPNGKRFYPPFNSEQEAWMAVDSYAKNGSQFCKALIANSIMFFDIIEVFNLDLDNPAHLQQIYCMQQSAYATYTELEQNFNFYDYNGNKKELMSDMNMIAQRLGLPPAFPNPNDKPKSNNQNKTVTIIYTIILVIIAFIFTYIRYYVL